MNLDKRWKWLVTNHYNDTVKPPKIPGEVAIETAHADDVSKDIELEACAKRTDITTTVTKNPNWRE